MIRTVFVISFGIVILSSIVIASLGAPRFTGVTVNNKARGPIEITVRCFLDQSSFQHHVLASDEPPQDIRIVCPGEG